jgi:predicted RND superfamily exporter protein
VDYGIHVIFGLRAAEGAQHEAFTDVTKALGLCAATTIAGFASLGAATTEGLASLGLACALGVGFNALVALFLLPHVWRMIKRKKTTRVPC